MVVRTNRSAWLTLGAARQELEGYPTGTGELETCGPHVMQGYWGDEAATAAVLSPDEWLRTGDLGWKDASGNFWLVGRLKDVIRSGGENVSAPEVERVLIRHPHVCSAAVVALPHVRFGEQVAACVVLEEGTPWTGPCMPVPTAPQGTDSHAGPQPQSSGVRAWGAGQSMGALHNKPGPPPQSDAVSSNSTSVQEGRSPGSLPDEVGLIGDECRPASATLHSQDPQEPAGVPWDGGRGGAGRESVPAGPVPIQEPEVTVCTRADEGDEGRAGDVNKVPPKPGGRPGDAAGGEEVSGKAPCLGSQRDCPGVEGLSGSALRQFCLKEGLSPFMVPRVWVAQWWPLPQNSSGKVLKNEVVKEVLGVIQAPRERGQSKL